MTISIYVGAKNRNVRLMKSSTIIPVILFTYLSISLPSCSSYEGYSQQYYHSYDDVENLQIPYESLLKMQDFEYFAYIYSLNCLHCETIKNEVIEFALQSTYPMYFIPYTRDIPLIDNIEHTLNQNTLDLIGILGTPTLFQIIDGTTKLNVSGSDIILSILKEY